MNKIHVGSFIVFILGIIFFIIIGLKGELHGGVFLVFPFLLGSGPYSVFGILLIILAFFLFIFGMATKPFLTDHLPTHQDIPEQKSIMKGGGIIIIGPIPIVVGSSWKITLTLILAAIFLCVLLYFLFYYG